MNKYRLAVNPYDIEKWVNDMARQGWHLKSSLGYVLHSNVGNQAAIFIGMMN